MNIVEGLAAIKTATDLLKIAREAAKAGTLKPDEFVGRVSEIYDCIIDTKAALVGLQEEVDERNDEIRALKEKLRAASEISGGFELRSGVYFRKGTNDAYCPLCMGGNNKVVPLARDGDGWCCGIHKVHFPGDDEGPGFAIIPGRF